MSWAFIGDLLIVFNSPGELTDKRLGELIRAVSEYPVKLKYGIGANIGRGQMTSVQRKRSSEVFSGVRLVSIVDDRITRGIVTALGWLGMNIKGFDWDHAKDAIEYLGIPGSDPDALLKVVEELRDRGMERVKEGKQG
ncbi:MAG: hypothetical protein H6712_34535 [Myxococcales bacterium]|nr:hypothetical protein [Myxococcales bacterium]MCB9719014.1 hypothetical protein [Myxococcales bacterium]